MTEWLSTPFTGSKGAIPQSPCGARTERPRLVDVSFLIVVVVVLLYLSWLL